MMLHSLSDGGRETLCIDHGRALEALLQSVPTCTREDHDAHGHCDDRDYHDDNDDHDHDDYDDRKFSHQHASIFTAVWLATQTGNPALPVDQAVTPTNCGGSMLSKPDVTSGVRRRAEVQITVPATIPRAVEPIDQAVTRTTSRAGS